ncbi:hypothetical protein Tco_0875960 [Tanacetum coccineum]|uniref:Uncharacterized protein n=1 Tax=Tanacetum coccineum TaxID=301880 RepID=A0ABQ5BSL0_9ASTR
MLDYGFNSEIKIYIDNIRLDRALDERLQEGRREQFTAEEEQNSFMEQIDCSKKISCSQRLEARIASSKNESVKEEGKEEEGTKKRKSGHIKMIARKKPRKQSDDDSDDEHRKCLKIVTFEGTLDSEIMEKKYVIARLDKDLFHLYELMMEQYSEITLEGFELILWGDLKIMMESSTEENDQSDFWSNQQDWKIITWRLYEACGVCILELEDGIVIHMLVERRYPLSKELLQRMLDLGLEVERESSVALDLIRFIKQQIDEE